MGMKEDKISNPTKFYHSPKEVKDDEGLTKSEKVTLLMNWLDEEKLKSTATEENMLPSGKAEPSYVLSLERLLEYYKTH